MGDAVNNGNPPKIGKPISTPLPPDEEEGENKYSVSPSEKKNTDSLIPIHESQTRD